MFICTTAKYLANLASEAQFKAFRFPQETAQYAIFRAKGRPTFTINFSTLLLKASVKRSTIFFNIAASVELRTRSTHLMVRLISPLSTGLRNLNQIFFLQAFRRIKINFLLENNSTCPFHSNVFLSVTGGFSIRKPNSSILICVQPETTSLATSLNNFSISKNCEISNLFTNLPTPYMIARLLNT